MTAFTDRTWLVHPGFDHPREIFAPDRGVEERDLPQWFLGLSEDDQAETLRRRWSEVCDWVIAHGANRVTVANADPDQEVVLRAWDFRLVDDGGVQTCWQFEGSPEAVRKVLDSLGDLAAISLKISRAQDLLAFVVDDSWDAVYVVSRTRPPFSALRPRTTST